MKENLTKQDIFFIKGGGEMGKRIREHNWSETAVGNPKYWPQSLRTTLSILINSKFPMFLWWGPELICFYNDAYRPSLGLNGKHPSILGQPAATAWTEIWHIIKPLIDQVLAGGESTWSEDQLIPIYRNGKLEDVYWTFSYSAVNDESGKPAGVFVTCSETTDKIINFNKLRESRDELKFAIESAELGTFDYSPVSGKFSANQRLKDWFGLLPEEEIALRHAIDSIADEDKQLVSDAIARSLEFENGGKYDIIYKIIHPVSKKETIVHAKGRTWFTEQKTAHRFNGTLQDITTEFLIQQNLQDVVSELELNISQRKKSEEKLVLAIKQIQENQEKLNIIIEASELGNWELDLKNDSIEYSERYLEIFGFRKQDALTHDQMLNTLHPQDRQIRDMAMQQALINGTLYYECRLIWADKSIHWIEVKGRVFYDDKKNPLKLIGTIRDTTVDKNHQQELRESEQKFRLLADSMPQFVWTGDADGNLNYFNRAVYNYSGLSPEQVKKEGWLQIVHPDEREENIREWVHSVKTGASFNFEHRFQRHDGNYRWQLSRAIPQKDAMGNIQMWVGTSTDIEAQKAFLQELETQVQERTAQLKQKNLELEKMNDELKSFAYVSSHDLQEPLRKILTFSDRILETEAGRLSAEGRNYFGRIINATERMRKLIEDLLSYSRTNSEEYIFEIADLTELVKEVEEELKDSIKEKNARLIFADLGSYKIMRFQFFQLFQNLISNALKFASPHRSPVITIRSAYIKGHQTAISFLSPNQVYCHISVADNGIGFEPQYNQKVFELFQRLHGSYEYSGTGIGLSIVKKIVENHHGVIMASGQPDQGAVFDIYLAVNYQ